MRRGLEQTPRQHEKSLPRPEDESDAKQPRVDCPSPPDPGGASSAGIPPTSTSRGVLGTCCFVMRESYNETNQATITGSSVVEREWTSAAWLRRFRKSRSLRGAAAGLARCVFIHGARTVHLQGARGSRLAGPAAGNQAALGTVGWKKTTTTRPKRDSFPGSYEQELTGQENFYSAKPQPATQRLLVVVAQSLWLAVAVGDCAQALLQAPILEKSDVWATPRRKLQWKLDGRAVCSRLGDPSHGVTTRRRPRRSSTDWSPVHATRVCRATCARACAPLVTLTTTWSWAVWPRRHALTPTASDRTALKRLIRSLSTTRNMALGSFGGAHRCG